MINLHFHLSDIIGSLLLFLVAIGTLILQWSFYKHQKNINRRIIEFEELKRFPLISYIWDYESIDEFISNTVLTLCNESESPIIIWEICLLHNDWQNKTNNEVIKDIFQNKMLVDSFADCFTIGSKEKIVILEFNKTLEEIICNSDLSKKQTDYMKSFSVKLVYSSSLPRKEAIPIYLENGSKDKINYKIFEKTIKLT